MNITQRRITLFGKSELSERVLHATRVRLLEAVAAEVAIQTEPRDDATFTIAGKFYNVALDAAHDEWNIILEWEATTAAATAAHATERKWQASRLLQYLDGELQ